METAYSIEEYWLICRIIQIFETEGVPLHSCGPKHFEMIRQAQKYLAVRSVKYTRDSFLDFSEVKKWKIYEFFPGWLSLKRIAQKCDMQEKIKISSLPPPA